MAVASATRVGEIEWNLGRRAVLLLRRTHCEVLLSLSFCSVLFPPLGMMPPGSYFKRRRGRGREERDVLKLRCGG